MGWPTGLEPATSRTTIWGSTIELWPPARTSKYKFSSLASQARRLMGSGVFCFSGFKSLASRWFGTKLRLSTTHIPKRNTMLRYTVLIMTKAFQLLLVIQFYLWPLSFKPSDFQFYFGGSNQKIMIIDNFKMRANLNRWVRKLIGKPSFST